LPSPYISNVVPYQQPQLSYQEDNAILEEFSERPLRPHAERAVLRDSSANTTGFS
jgi:hypothetical protein